MSSILKFVLMAVAWLLFTLATFYTCVKPACCGGELMLGAVTDSLATDPPPREETFAVYSTLGATGAGAAVTGNDWPALLSDLKARYAADPQQILEVYGNYYAAEPKPADYANMGFLRAETIKAMLVDQAGIPATKIRGLARLLDDAPPAAGERFDAGSFVWEAAGAGIDETTGEERSQVVQLDRDNIKVRFPYDESTRALDADTETYLRTLAERIKTTGETVTIVGHTDVRGSTDYNQALGQRRADFIRGRLTGYGAPAGQLRTSSRGESQPEARGDTEDAHRRNRRTEITLERQ